MTDPRTDDLEQRSRHDPAAVESQIFARWESAGLFRGDPTSERPSYVIAVPPPNVTGELHMGHALQDSIMDTLIRLHGMRGYETLWICGTDHAGIATQNVVEKELRKQGLSRHDLGREAFVERVWEWRRQYGATIIQQLKQLGCALDYDNERFTMDDAYAQAVMEVFVALHRTGYIFRGNRIVNWCPSCGSAISDLEVRYEHAADTLYEVRYRIAGSDAFLKVATVRPETILADTAVAVHPDDERYRHLVGSTAIVPLAGREVPVIADEYVKMDFGTGALKVTPGHDPNDFEIGRRHGLEELVAIGFDGRMTDIVPEYAGLTAAEARERVRNDLFAQGLLGDEHDYEHEVGHCDRSGDRIEPLISLQWFMQMQELAAPANAAVRSGAVRFVPRSRERIYFDFMDNIRPWCVSRQLWWGHQIPVWYCPNGHSTCAVTEPDSCKECGSSQLERDPDVLDTWFSSALWPFATLGWPEETERLAAFYPSNVLVTDRGIINLWVARMMMMGIEFTGEIPYPDVFIHSTIQAPDGRRMSKSLGTGINPLDLIDRYGADATRYGLLKMSSTQDVRFAEGMIDEGAKLANKLWNASRFVLLQADTTVAPAAGETTLEDRWMLSRLEGASAEVLRLIDEYDFAGAVKALYSLIWNDFCDWYVEVTKSRLYGDDQEARGDVSATLLWVLERILALAHPVLPFVTEEIWSFMPRERDLLMASPMPEPQPQRRHAALEEAAIHDMEVVSEARRIANEGETPSVVVRSDTLFRSLLPKSAAVSVDEAAPAASAVASANAAQLQSKLDEAVAEFERAQAKLANERFTERAPAELVDAEREKARRFEAEVADLRQRLADL